MERSVRLLRGARQASLRAVFSLHFGLAETGKRELAKNEKTRGGKKGAVIRGATQPIMLPRTPRHEIPPDFWFFSATDTAKIVTCEKALMSELKRRLRILGE